MGDAGALGWQERLARLATLVEEPGHRWPLNDTLTDPGDRTRFAADLRAALAAAAASSPQEGGGGPPSVGAVTKVGALRAALAGLPDGMEVLVHLPDDDCSGAVRSLESAGVDGTCEGTDVFRLVVAEDDDAPAPPRAGVQVDREAPAICPFMQWSGRGDNAEPEWGCRLTAGHEGDHSPSYHAEPEAVRLIAEALGANPKCEGHTRPWHDCSCDDPTLFTEEARRAAAALAPLLGSPGETP